MIRRGASHDQSKLHEPEAGPYERHIPQLKDMVYGSDEYKAAMNQPEFKNAIKHHYEVNDHHPEHFERGVYDMNLMQLIEMLVDWKAASERHATRDFARSLDVNQERFGIDGMLMQVLRNTAQDLGYLEESNEHHSDGGGGHAGTAADHGDAHRDPVPGEGG